MRKNIHRQTKKKSALGLETRLQVLLLPHTAFFHVLAEYVIMRRSVSLILRLLPSFASAGWGLGMRLRSVSSNQIAEGFEFCSLIGYMFDALPTGLSHYLGSSDLRMRPRILDQSVLGPPCPGTTLSWDHPVLGPPCPGTTLSWDQSVLGPPCPGTNLSWDHPVLGPPCPGTTLSWDQSVLGPPCPGTTLSWDQSVLGPPCPGTTLSWDQSVLGPPCPGTDLSWDHPVLGPPCPGTDLSSAPQRWSWATSKKKVVYSAEVQAFDEPPWWERNCGTMQRENPTFSHILNYYCIIKYLLLRFAPTMFYITSLLLGIFVVAIRVIVIQYFDPEWWNTHPLIISSIHKVQSSVYRTWKQDKQRTETKVTCRLTFLVMLFRSQVPK